MSIGSWTDPVAEFEIAVHLGRDLPGGSSRETASQAIGSIGPAIELADLHFPPKEPESILAANVYQRHVILGTGDASRAGGMLTGLTGRVYRQGIEIASTSDLEGLTGDTVDNIQRVADLLALFGLGLRAGDVIITGSIVEPIHASPGTDYRFNLEPVGGVDVRFGD